MPDYTESGGVSLLAGRGRVACSVSLARATRGRGLPSLDARSGRPIQATLLEEIHASEEGPLVKGLFDARNRGSTRPHSLRENWRLAQEGERVRASLEGAFICAVPSLSLKSLSRSTVNLIHRKRDGVALRSR